MTSLYYDTLGNIALHSYGFADHRRSWAFVGLRNTGPFYNFHDVVSGTSTGVAKDEIWLANSYATDIHPDSAWYMRTDRGFICHGPKSPVARLAWAVHPGDVGTVIDEEEEEDEVDEEEP